MTKSEATIAAACAQANEMVKNLFTIPELRNSDTYFIREVERIGLYVIEMTGLYILRLNIVLAEKDFSRLRETSQSIAWPNGFPFVWTPRPGPHPSPRSPHLRTRHPALLGSPDNREGPRPPGRLRYAPPSSGDDQPSDEGLKRFLHAEE